MNVLISISHPASAHQFKNMIKLLEKRGHKVFVLVVKKDLNWEILDECGISYIIVGNATGKNYLDKAWILFYTTIKHVYYVIKFKIDITISMESPMLAITALLTGKKNIAYCDTERSAETLWFVKRFSYKMLTPMLYRKNLGKNHIRVDTFKELFYLHPNYFEPNPKDLELVGLKKGEVFTFLRFVAWNASHDIGYKGFSNKEKMELIKHFEKYGKVLVSSEEKLPPEFDDYVFKIPHSKLHSIMSFAQLFVGDGLTMACEACVMGVHAVFTSELTAGVNDEFGEKYELMYTIEKRENMLDETIKLTKKLLENPKIVEVGKEKRDKLLSEKKDIIEWWINYLEKEVK